MRFRASTGFVAKHRNLSPGSVKLGQSPSSLGLHHLTWNLGAGRTAPRTAVRVQVSAVPAQCLTTVGTSYMLIPLISAPHRPL